MTTFHEKGIAAILATALATTGFGLAAQSAMADGNTLPTTGKAPTYSAFQAVTDPGKDAKDYFQPYWYSNTINTGPTAGSGAHHIQAHGGNILPVTENGRTVYYWYGESHEHGYGNSPGVHCYKSTDLYNWTDMGIVLRTVSNAKQMTDPANPDYRYFHDLYGDKATKVMPYLLTNGDSDGDGKTDQLTAIIERPKVIHNPKTGKWVMWFHSDGSISVGGSNYSRALLGVAVADSPTGPYRLTGAYKGMNDNDDNAGGWGEIGDARDMTAYVASDGNAYVGYSSEGNTTTYVAKLDDTWTHLARTVPTDQSKSRMQYSEDGRYTDILGGKRGTDWQIVTNERREAIGFLEYGGRVYAITSGTSGWNPNLQNYYSSDHILGVYGKGTRLTRGLSSDQGAPDSRSTTFGSQLASILPYDPARGEFIYVGDRWDSGGADSTYVVLPLVIRDDGTLTMANPGSWTLDYWRKTGTAHTPVYNATDLKGVTATVGGKPVAGFDPVRGGSFTVPSDTKDVVLGNVPDGWKIVKAPQGLAYTVSSPDGKVKVAYTFTPEKPAYSGADLKGVTATVDGKPVAGFDPVKGGTFTVPAGTKTVALDGVPSGWKTDRTANGLAYTVTSPDGTVKTAYTFTPEKPAAEYSLDDLKGMTAKTDKGAPVKDFNPTESWTGPVEAGTTSITFTGAPKGWTFEKAYDSSAKTLVYQAVAPNGDVKGMYRFIVGGTPTGGHSITDLKNVTAETDKGPVEGFDPTSVGPYRLDAGHGKIMLRNLPEGWTSQSDIGKNGAGTIAVLSPDADTIMVYAFTTPNTRTSGVTELKNVTAETDKGVAVNGFDPTRGGEYPVPADTRNVFLRNVPGEGSDWIPENITVDKTRITVLASSDGTTLLLYRFPATAPTTPTASPYSPDDLKDVTATADGKPVNGFDPVKGGNFTVPEGTVSVALHNIPKEWTRKAVETGLGYTLISPDGRVKVVYTFTPETKPSNPSKPSENTGTPVVPSGKPSEPSGGSPQTGPSPDTTTPGKERKPAATGTVRNGDDKATKTADRLAQTGVAYNRPALAAMLLLTMAVSFIVAGIRHRVDGTAD